MKFTMFDHAGKGAYLRQRLIDAGHQLTQEIDEVELLLLDCDWPWAYPRPQLIATARLAGAKVALYPHGGWPTVFAYDGLAKPEDVDVRLEHGKGSLDIAATFTEDDLKQQATGWLYSPTAEFKPVKKAKRVLFAPMHPNMEMLQQPGNGHDPAPSFNQQLYRQLLDLPGVELTVTMVGPAWRNGIWRHPRATFLPNHRMLFQHSAVEIDKADVVVAAGTMAATAVARGKPTVMFAQDVSKDYVNGVYQEADHADLYRDMVRYPIDASDGPLAELLERASAGDEAVDRWRELWVGDDGTANAVRILEQLVQPEQQNVIIEGVTARAGAKL